MLTFRVGRVESPEADDATLHDIDEAIKKATSESMESSSVWAVWEIYDNGNSDIRCLVYEGDTYF